MTVRGTPGHRGGVRAFPAAAALAAAAVTVTTLVAPRPARAAGAESIHLAYAAPPGCPSEGVLVSAAGEMGASFREAAPGARARTMDVVVEKARGGFTGSLAVEGPGGDRRVRTVPAGTCDRVVRTLGLFVAMALSTEETPAPLVAPASVAHDELPSDAATPLDRPTTEPAEDDGREPGGVAAMAVWSRADLSGQGVLQGAAVMAVFDADWARAGGIVAFAPEDVSDGKYGTSTQPAVAVGHGESLRLGAVASWGAPWSRTSWAGLVAEAGVRGAVVKGAMWPLPPASPWGSCAPSDPDVASCAQGPGTPRTWTFVAPYVAATGVVQILPKAPVRPFVGLSVVWSGDYRGNSYAMATANLGLAWRTW